MAVPCGTPKLVARVSTPAHGEPGPDAGNSDRKAVFDPIRKKLFSDPDISSIRFS